jgi:Zn-dependent peptidase ImmA (M78 family)
MAESKQLAERLLFSAIPPDWQHCAISVDWQGEPLVLFGEGRPQPPSRDAGMEAIRQWLSTPPRRHHLLHWKDGVANQVTFENPTALLTTSHVQPFGDGWLVAEGRGGFARVFDERANLIRTLDLGDAIEHVNTTPDGHIWVGYFDEGVFGSGIGDQGLVRFDSAGSPTFKYAEFASKGDLPFISDCYSLNVFDSSVYVSYYTDFPLVWISDLRLRRLWNDFGPNKAIAVRSDHFVVFPAYDKPYLTMRPVDSPDVTVWELVTSQMSFDFMNEVSFLPKHHGKPTEIRAALSMNDRLVVTQSGLHDKRKRFGVFHEIGHFISEEHREKLFFVDTDTTLSWWTKIRMEREANEIAAELLFQGNRFTTEATDAPTSIRTVLDLAPSYGASYESALRRYTERHVLPCALIVFDKLPKESDDEEDEETKFKLQYVITSPLFRRRYFSALESKGPVTHADFFGDVGYRNRFDIVEHELAVEGSEGNMWNFETEVFTNGYKLFQLLVKPL